MDMATDKRVFKTLTSRPCVQCSEQTNFCITGLGYLCQPKCVEAQLTTVLEGRGLRHWVRIELDQEAYA